MIINELGDSPIRSGNVYFANIEEESLVFFVAHAEHNLIKPKYTDSTSQFRPVKYPLVTVSRKNFEQLWS